MLGMHKYRNLTPIVLEQVTWILIQIEDLTKKCLNKSLLCNTCTIKSSRILPEGISKEALQLGMALNWTAWKLKTGLHEN